MGMLGDKDVNAVIRIMRPLGEIFICVTPESPRAMPAEELAAKLRQIGAEAVAASDIQEGVRLAITRGEKEKKPVVAFGSLYMAGDVRRILRGM